MGIIWNTGAMDRVEEIKRGRGSLKLPRALSFNVKTLALTFYFLCGVKCGQHMQV